LINSLLFVKYQYNDQDGKLLSQGITVVQMERKKEEKRVLK